MRRVCIRDHGRPAGRVSIARRRLVVLRLLGIFQQARYERWVVSIARRRLVVLRRGTTPRPLGRTHRVSIARRRLVVLRRTPNSCGSARSRFVSIARRRLVVLRHAGWDETSLRDVISFNRPKAISCLATPKQLTLCQRAQKSFNRPKAISCLATRVVRHDLRHDEYVFQSPEGD